MKQLSSANRLKGFDKPTVWSVMTPLAVATKSVNLGQGFPSWEPPQFYKDFLAECAENANHQYTRAFGSLNYVQAIANYSKKTYKNINPETDIVAVNGGVQGLYCSFLGFVNEGEEVLLFDPSYDCYRPQIQMAGGKSVGLPMRPRRPQSKEELKKRSSKGYFSGQNDIWDIDFEAFQKAITPRTKIFLLNSPHNPIGKVFTQQELEKLAKILRAHPQIIVIEDNVYEGMTFDDMLDQPLPKMAFQEGMYDRTVSVYSAGKIFAATGVRQGWVIGPSHLIKAVRSVHQYTVFCGYNVLESTVAKGLDLISQPGNTYMHDYAIRLSTNRDLLLTELINSKYDLDLWVPKGGYFVIADISRIEIGPKYLADENGVPRTKDYAFCVQMAYEKGVVAIPCSPFYAPEDSHIGQKYVRFAFCKETDMILEAGKRLK